MGVTKARGKDAMREAEGEEKREAGIERFTTVLQEERMDVVWTRAFVDVEFATYSSNEALGDGNLMQLTRGQEVRLRFRNLDKFRGGRGRRGGTDRSKMGSESIDFILLRDGEGVVWFAKRGDGEGTGARADLAEFLPFKFARRWVFKGRTKTMPRFIFGTFETEAEIFHGIFVDGMGRNGGGLTCLNALQTGLDVSVLIRPMGLLARNRNFSHEGGGE